jgi:hypothetical protein
VVTASAGADRYILDAGNTESDVLRSFELRDGPQGDLRDDDLVIRLKPIQFSTTGNRLVLGARELLSGVEQVRWDEGLGELVIIGDVVTIATADPAVPVDLGNTHLRIEAGTLNVEGIIKAPRITLNVSGLVSLDGELSSPELFTGSTRVAATAELAAGAVDLSTLLPATPGVGLQIVPTDPSTPIQLGGATGVQARSLAGAALSLDPAGLSGSALPVLVLGANGGSNPVSIGGGGSPISLNADLVVNAQGPGGKVTLAGSLSGKALEVYGPGNTTVLADGTLLRMSDAILIDDSVRAEGTVTIAAGWQALSPQDLTITGRINGTEGDADHLTLQSNGGQVRVAGAIGNGVAAAAILIAGAGYADGLYESVDLLGGSGRGALARITVQGGQVVDFEVTAAGAGYRLGDKLRVARSSLGAASAEGLVAFSAQVSALQSIERLTVEGAGDLSFEDKVVVDGDLVIRASGKVIFLDTVSLMNGGRLIIDGAAELYLNDGLQLERGDAAQAGVLQFTSSASDGATVTASAGVARGDGNRFAIDGVKAMTIQHQSGSSRLGMLAEGGVMRLAAPIGQTEVRFDLARLAFEAESLELPVGMPTQFDVDELKLRTQESFGSPDSPIRLTASRVDLQSVAGDLFTIVPNDVEVLGYRAGSARIAGLLSEAGSIRVAPDALVSGDDIRLNAPTGAISAGSGSLISGGQLTIVAAEGAGSAGQPLNTQVERLTATVATGSLHFDESDDVAVVPEGLLVGSPAGGVVLNAGGDVVMMPPARISTAGGSVELGAQGGVGLSEIDSGSGSIRVDAGGAIYDATKGSAITNLRTTSTLSLNAVTGIGGFGMDDLKVNAPEINAFNAQSGHIVIAGEEGIRAGSEGIRNESRDGYVALFAITGKVETGNIKAASGRMVLLSGRSGLSERETAGIFYAITMGPSMGASTSGSGNAAISGASASSGLGSFATSAPTLSSPPMSLSTAPSTLLEGGGRGSLGSTLIGGESLMSTTGTVIVAGRPVEPGASATSAVMGEAVEERHNQLDGERGTSVFVAGLTQSGSVGSITTLGRSTALMLDAALKTLEMSSRPVAVGSMSISELVHRTPQARPDASRGSAPATPGPADRDPVGRDAAPAQPVQAPVPGAPAVAAPSQEGSRPVQGRPAEGRAAEAVPSAQQAPQAPESPPAQQGLAGAGADTKPGEPAAGAAASPAAAVPAPVPATPEAQP